MKTCQTREIGDAGTGIARSACATRYQGRSNPACTWNRCTESQASPESGRPGTRFRLEASRGGLNQNPWDPRRFRGLTRPHWLWPRERLLAWKESFRELDLLSCAIALPSSEHDLLLPDRQVSSPKHPNYGDLRGSKPFRIQ